MKRTLCLAVACALGLTLAASAQTGNIRNSVNSSTDRAGIVELSNTPNPVTFDTRIEYTLHRAGYVRLNIFDSNGTLIEALVDETWKPDAIRPSGTPPTGDLAYFYAP